MGIQTNVLRFFFLASTLGLNIPSFSKPFVQLMTDPGRSMNGESILFKIRISNDTDAEIQAPRMPILTDWQITNSYSSTSRSTKFINGDFKYTLTTELTYILRPLRKGLLKIPSLTFLIGEDTYKTAETTIQVDRIAQNQTRPTPGPRTFQGPSGASPSNPFSKNNPSFKSPPPSTDFDVPERELFFVRAEPSKKTVYEKELITLSYSIYQRKPLGLAEPGISKFPDFKGFLKEELEIRRDFTPVPFSLRGESMYRAELIRFAVFPLKAGRVRVEPLRFKATLVPSAADLMNAMMSGMVPSTNGIPMEKSSQELIIDAKPLPPLPAGAAFTNGVGQFQVEVKGPSGHQLQVDQPFTLTVKISGRGNIKSFEKPEFNFPKSFEESNVRTNYEFRSDASGYRSFEYIVIPRSSGKVSLDGLEWTYFDPQKEKYLTYKGEPMVFSVAPSASADDSRKQLPQTLSFSAWKSGNQNFKPWQTIFQPGFLGSKTLWTAQAIFYAFLFLVFSTKKVQERKKIYFQLNPWEKTAKLISQQKEWDNQQLALLIDQWTRERLAGLLRDVQKEIHHESSRDEFMDALRENLLVEYHEKLEPLCRYWSDLDLMRFSGSRSSRAKGADFMQRATRIFAVIINALEKSRTLRNKKINDPVF